jgi:hypothetical protein
MQISTQRIKHLVHTWEKMLKMAITMMVMLALRVLGISAAVGWTVGDIEGCCCGDKDGLLIGAIVLSVGAFVGAAAVDFH